MIGYVDQLQTLPDLQFVTLTAIAVPASELKGRIIEMRADFKRIRDTMRKRKTPINGFLKTECNYNPQRKTFNPHFHIIISGTEVAEEVVRLWLGMLNNRGTSPEAQNIRPLDQNGLNEVFKYTTKSLTKNKHERNVVEVSVDAFNTIMEALHKTKVFQPIGCVKKTVEEDTVCDILESQNMQGLLFNDFKAWEWNRVQDDWTDQDGNKLTGYKPPDIKFHYKQFKFHVKNGNFWESLRDPFNRIYLNPLEINKRSEKQWSTNVNANSKFLG